MARRRLVPSEAAQQRVTSGNIVDRNLRPYKGVTFYKRTGRWEANLWYENKQHYLGASFSALEAARAYDKGILFTRSSTEQLNFDRKDYKEDLRKMRGMSFIKYRQYLRDTSRKAKCKLVNKSLKGILIDEHGKWEVKYCLKYLPKPKYVLIGWFDKEEEALRAYNETALQYDDERATIRSFHQKHIGHSNGISSDKGTVQDHEHITSSSTTESFPLRGTGETTPDDSENEALAVVPFEELDGEDMVVDTDNLDPALRITPDDSENEALAVVPFEERDREDMVMDTDNLDPELRITPDDSENEALAVVPFEELDREDMVMDTDNLDPALRITVAPEETNNLSFSTANRPEVAYQGIILEDCPSIGMPQTNFSCTWVSDNLQRYHNLEDEDLKKAFSHLVLIYAMRREGYDDFHILSFIQWMESTFQPTQETEITPYNFFPDESPRVLNSEIRSYQLFPEGSPALEKHEITPYHFFTDESPRVQNSEIRFYQFFPDQNPTVEKHDIRPYNFFPDHMHDIPRLTDLGHLKKRGH